MMVNLPSSLWSIRWVGPTKRDLSLCSQKIKSTFGQALFEAQRGMTPFTAKPLKAFAGAVWELRAWDDTGTYRLVYAVKLEKAIYVLHVFQKKAKHGISTPRKELALIETRLGVAREMDAARH